MLVRQAPQRLVGAIALLTLGFAPLLLQPVPVLVAHGKVPGERLGALVGTVGDLDGDGRPEWLAARGGETSAQPR